MKSHDLRDTWSHRRFGIRWWYWLIVPAVLLLGLLAHSEQRVKGSGVRVQRKEVSGPSRSEILSACPFWLAQYGPRAVVPPAWKIWTLWQYTDQGKLPGHGVRNFDRNRFHGTVEDLKRWWVGQ